MSYFRQFSSRTEMVRCARRLMTSNAGHNSNCSTWRESILISCARARAHTHTHTHARARTHARTRARAHAHTHTQMEGERERKGRQNWCSVFLHLHPHIPSLSQPYSSCMGRETIYATVMPERYAVSHPTDPVSPNS